MCILRQSRRMYRLHFFDRVYRMKIWTYTRNYADIRSLVDRGIGKEGTHVKYAYMRRARAISEPS